MYRRTKTTLIGLLAGLGMLLQTASAVRAEAPKIAVRATRLPDGAIALRLLGWHVAEFSALSADLRFGQAPLGEARCIQPPGNVPKTALCSQPSSGVVRVLLTGFGNESLREGELIRVQFSGPAAGRARRYPVSALVHLARPDGSEFEIGPVGTTMDLTPRRAR